jgi:hypothetical protein
MMWMTKGIISYQGTIHKTKSLDLSTRRIPNLPVDFWKIENLFLSTHLLIPLTPSRRLSWHGHFRKHRRRTISLATTMTNMTTVLLHRRRSLTMMMDSPVMLPEKAYFPEDMTVVRCLSWDQFRLMTPPPPANIIRMRFSKESIL